MAIHQWFKIYDYDEKGRSRKSEIMQTSSDTIVFDGDGGSADLIGGSDPV